MANALGNYTICRIHNGITWFMFKQMQADGNNEFIMELKSKISL